MRKFTAHVRSLKKIVQWIIRNYQEFVETESRMVVTEAWGWGKWGNVAQRVKTFNFRVAKFGGIYVQYGD